jgi:hypothetical protein
MTAGKFTEGKNFRNRVFRLIEITLESINIFGIFIQKISYSSIGHISEILFFLNLETINSYYVFF